jgi:hypothetical protein
MQVAGQDSDKFIVDTNLEIFGEIFEGIKIQRYAEIQRANLQE